MRVSRAVRWSKADPRMSEIVGERQTPISTAMKTAYYVAVGDPVVPILVGTDRR